MAGGLASPGKEAMEQVAGLGELCLGAHFLWGRHLLVTSLLCRPPGLEAVGPELWIHPIHLRRVLKVTSLVASLETCPWFLVVQC